MKDIPNELKFSSNKNISGYKFKPILVTSENVRKENKSRAVHAAGLSWLWDTGESHFAINHHYVKKFWEDFRLNETTHEIYGRDYKAKYDINIDFTYQDFMKNN